MASTEQNSELSVPEKELSGGSSPNPEPVEHSDKETKSLEQPAEREPSISKEIQDRSPAPKDGAALERTVSYLPLGPKLYLIVVSLMLAVFCVALDNTILAVAIPRITDEFHSLNDVGWYISVYLLTSCAFQLFFGKMYSLFNVKWVFLVALFIFEVGSLICGVSPNSIALILGRAIAGFGSGGIFSGAIITIGETVVLERRPIFFALVGGMYGIASVAGPLMGGAFTDRVTWRWCFYINLPLGGITAVGLLTLLRLKQKPEAGLSWSALIKKLDVVGTTIFIGAIVCALLALQWGGSTYAWSDGRIIALFVLFGAFLIAFVAIEIYLKENALVPPRIASQRTIAFACLFGALIGGSFFIFVYYVPIWFQAIKGVSPVTAGVDSLPLILANVFAIIASGVVTTKTGYFAPWFYASTVLMSIGAGLLYTFTPDTSQAAWVGYQFLFGLGTGCAFQQGGVAAQAVLGTKDVAIGTAVVIFVQIFGGAIFVAVAQNLFQTTLIERVLALNIPGLNPEILIAAGATGIRNVVDPDVLPQLLVEYNTAIVKTFQLGLILACLCIFGAVGIEWKSVKTKPAAHPA